MATTTDIKGVPVQFPFPPYDIQKDYMEKVIDCLQNESVAVLESPTGTGKTLSLLCSTLAWLQLKKTQLEAHRLTVPSTLQNEGDNYLEELQSELEQKAGKVSQSRMFLGVPTIIYASRTHSQLSQAMQELKRSAYSHMRGFVLGSREQLCIHPEVKAEQDTSTRLHMCRLKRQTRSCHYNNRVEEIKDDPDICNIPIIDIEDMIKLGNKHTFCPYYMTKELKQKADIIFTPYNYLLDPIARKALVFSLSNSVIILDEGHNIEKVCEEKASVEVKTTDLLLAITELDVIMKYISTTSAFSDSSSKDIDPDDVANFKSMLLRFTDIVQEIPLNTRTDDVTSHPGDYIYTLLEQANITGTNFHSLLGMIDVMIQFLVSQGDGPFARKGKGLQLFSDFLTIVFGSKGSKEKISDCYKVHIKEEERTGQRGGFANTWLSANTSSSSSNVRVLSFWCFSPGFGMDLIMNQNIRALILTSGTLAPLKPLISELELNVQFQLENPHIVKENQICVKILTKGPDGEPLNSSFQNRENPKYVSSLGRAIVNLSRIIPNGLLIFFPSYPIMLKCQNAWQAEGIWGNIMAHKAIFVEPRDKDAFNEAMTGYYEKIRDPSLKGAIFMAVCRGKVSEGLDFADANGRAVIITGLPYPPLKDAKVILKRRYLDQCHAKNKEYLTGSDWYSLEASRAVNQAVGRVIRHRHDYGAILLLDERFANFRIKEQMSKWLKNHVKVVNKYGEIIKDLSQFFRKAQSELPAPEMKPPINPPKATTTSSDSVSSNLGTTDNPNGLVAIHSSKRQNLGALVRFEKKKKITLIHPKHGIGDKEEETDNELATASAEFTSMVKNKLGLRGFRRFTVALRTYSSTCDLQAFLNEAWSMVPSHLRYIFTGLYRFIKTNDQDEYKKFLQKNDLAIPENF